MTLEEQERLAYITGDTEKARLLAELIDAKREANSDDKWHDGYQIGYRDGQDAS